jgi:MYXO-CTERM domain-containing protein
MKPPQKPKSTKGLKAVCLAAGLCLAAWCSPAQASFALPTYYYEISGSVSPNEALSDVYVIVGTSNPSYEWVYPIPSIKGGNTSSYSFVVAEPAPVADPPPSHYTVLGLFGSSVAVALNSTAAGNATVSSGWDAVFSGYTETALAGYLKAGKLNYLANFFQTYYSSQFNSLGNGASLVNFSPSLGGTASGNTTTIPLTAPPGLLPIVDPVPLPPTLALVLPGLGAILLLRRRKSSKT